MPPTAEVQLAWFSSALQELPAFLQSSDVFRPLHPPPAGMVQDLSLGTLRLTADALDARSAELSSAGQTSWDQARREWEDVQRSKAAAVRSKARDELPHRLNLWRSFLQDMEGDPTAVETYPIEARHRVLLDLLGDLVGEPIRGEAAGKIGGLDDRLRLRFMPGPFVWDEALKAVYPQPRFWYLYGGPAIPSTR